MKLGQIKALISWLRLLRPTQWTKNGIIVAALFFARWDPSQQGAAGLAPLLKVAFAFADFSLLASAIYIVNDIVDREADSFHPQKRHRPIASGRISPAKAIVAAIILGVVSLVGACLLSRDFALLALVYLALQLTYSFFLKKIAIVDVFVIALGFVIRAIAGAAVIGVRISPWLLLCTFLLALFLALCKRRHEKQISIDGSQNHRQALNRYQVQHLDQMIAITASATVIAYSLYTLTPETVARFGTHRLGFTIPFVVFGVFRYLELVYADNRGGRPERILLTDRILIVTILLYMAAALAIFIQSRYSLF